MDTRKGTRNRFLTFVLLASVCLPSHAEWRERRSALGEMYRIDEFRIFYSRSGRDALPNIEDANRNDTPDYVERIGRDLVTARERYEYQVGLRRPLTSPRYKNLAEFIDVNLLGFPLQPNGPKHGIAYDELSSFDRPGDAGRKVGVLAMDISNDLPANNATPAHELFHLYQNGYTFFKNRWYTEGTARWAEGLGKEGVGQAGRWPRSSAEIQELFRQTYETAPFWRQLAVKMDPDGGRGFVRAFLEELDRMDDEMSPSGRPVSGKWQEKDQMSSANDAYIWRALRNTLAQPAFLSRWDEDVQSLMAIGLQ